MHLRNLGPAFAAILLAGSAAASPNQLFISSNVNTGQLWHAPTAQGGGASGSCPTTTGQVQYYSAAFFTDTTASTYSLHLYYESFQSGFVYLYEDGFDPNDPCAGIFVFGHAPIANIYNITLQANRQYVFVTSEDQLFIGGGSFQVTIDGPRGSHIALGTPPADAVSFCAGDGLDPTVAIGCPCGNSGAGGHGCDNSVATGGSILSASGALSPDTLVLHASGELANAFSIFLQGNAQVSGGAPFGDGIRCAGGLLLRIAANNASAGSTSYPHPGEPGIRATSGNLGDPIPPGAVRYYQVYYRDTNLGFCPNPPGNSWNVSNALRVNWPW
jgi:hypothetical protein